MLDDFGETDMSTNNKTMGDEVLSSQTGDLSWYTSAWRPLEGAATWPIAVRY